MVLTSTKDSDASFRGKSITQRSRQPPAAVALQFVIHKNNWPGAKTKHDIKGHCQKWSRDVAAPQVKLAQAPAALGERLARSMHRR